MHTMCILTDSCICEDLMEGKINYNYSYFQILQISMISCYIFIDSENIIKFTTKIHIKIVLLSIVAHIFIPVYIMHSK